TISGTARIDPPPPTRPSENPTSAPDASPSAPCIAEISIASPEQNCTASSVGSGRLSMSGEARLAESSLNAAGGNIIRPRLAQSRLALQLLVALAVIAAALLDPLH